MSKTKKPEFPILIVDDEENFLHSAEVTLLSNGVNNVETLSDSRMVLKQMETKRNSLILLDINMPYISGRELLPKIVERYPEVPVIIVTAVNEVEQAVNCMKEGAFDYIVKPISDTRLLTTIKRGLDIESMRNENSTLRNYILNDQLEFPEAFEKIMTRSKSMRRIFKYIEAVSKTNLPILITGETGVGKELIAEAIHKISKREGNLVALNAAGVDDNLFADALFGHQKGAFTGADKERKGLLEHAQSGTLFLDEIGDLSIESQVKMLRLLQEGKYYPLGSDLPKLTDARIIAATHQNLDLLQKEGKFRKDLYFRLKAHHVHIPSLKERREDIPLLIDYFLNSASEELKKKKPTPPKELYTLLSSYTFPGNVRELEGIIYDAVSIHEAGILSLASIKEKIMEGIEISKETSSELSEIEFPETLPTLKELESMLIEEALIRTKGNQTQAAVLLGLTRRALNNRLRRSENSEDDD